VTGSEEIAIVEVRGTERNSITSQIQPLKKLAVPLIEYIVRQWDKLRDSHQKKSFVMGFDPRHVSDLVNVSMN